MAAQNAKDFVLKMGNGDGPPETFTAIAGFRSNNFNINGETVDITNKDSGGFRELLAGGGTTSLSASGSGTFLDDAKFATANTACLNREVHNWEIVVPDFGTYTAPFILTSLEMAGEGYAELTYSLSLESAGAITFTAA